MHEDAHTLMIIFHKEAALRKPIIYEGKSPNIGQDSLIAKADCSMVGKKIIVEAVTCMSSRVKMSLVQNFVFPIPNYMHWNTICCHKFSRLNYQQGRTTCISLGTGDSGG